jgi:hypothetical protein
VPKTYGILRRLRMLIEDALFAAALVFICAIVLWIFTGEDDDI